MYPLCVMRFILRFIWTATELIAILDGVQMTSLTYNASSMTFWPRQGGLFVFYLEYPLAYSRNSSQIGMLDFHFVYIEVMCLRFSHLILIASSFLRIDG